MGWIRIALIVVAGFGGFLVARSFVRSRLRFVDGIYSPVAPWLAGLGAALIAWPIAALPLITTTTTTIFGLGAGLGTASGVKALKRGTQA
jgi:hypothetical protein